MAEVATSVISALPANAVLSRARCAASGCPADRITKPRSPDDLDMRWKRRKRKAAGLRPTAHKNPEASGDAATQGGAAGLTARVPRGGGWTRDRTSQCIRPDARRIVWACGVLGSSCQKRGYRGAGEMHNHQPLGVVTRKSGVPRSQFIASPSLDSLLRRVDVDRPRSRVRSQGPQKSNFLGLCATPGNKNRQYSPNLS